MKANAIKKGIVLIVDDHPEDLDVLIASLQTCGLTILVAPQGEHALDLAEQFRPDVILLDVQMPDMEGFETRIRLKANNATRDISVIFMMASSEMVDTTKGLEVGGLDYLTKPFLPQEVIARDPTIRKLQQQLQKQHGLVKEEQKRQEELNFREAVEAYEKRLIAKALEQNLDNMAKTAARLGIPLRTLYRKIKKYQLQ